MGEFIYSICVSAKCDCQTKILQMSPLCFKKKFTKHVCAHLSFYEPDILHNNDIMQRFTYNEKIRDNLLQYNGINFTTRKNDSNFRELPLNRKTLFEK